jgi:hypothetical protein
MDCKQDYLRASILEAGHDPQHFLAFMSLKKQELDLDHWSMPELQALVN